MFEVGKLQILHGKNAKDNILNMFVFLLASCIFLIRQHGVGEEFIPTRFPELPKASGALGNCQKPMLYCLIVARTNEKLQHFKDWS